MDHAGDKQRWKQQCQPPANLSLGLSEEVAEWTDGSELLVLVQHFNSTRFLHERNSQINPGLISWQKVLVIFGHTSLEGVLDDPSFISSDLVPPSSCVPGFVLKEGPCCHPAPGTGPRDGQSRPGLSWGSHSIAVCVRRICKHQPFQNGLKMSSLTQKKKEKISVYQARI